MEIREILSRVDHTCLSVDATWEDIRRVTDEAIRYGTASVCIPPCFVGRASEYAAGRTKICTVIGFPNGYAETEIKCAETAAAVRNGADEIDMVIRIGWVKEEKYDLLLDEINRVKCASDGRLVKVIIETCRLTDEEKIRMCEVVSLSHADFIKTSTGFGGGGATFHDVELMAAHSSPRLGIKAAGGISSLADAERFLALGATRLGTSRIVRIVKDEGLL